MDLALAITSGVFSLFVLGAWMDRLRSYEYIPIGQWLGTLGIFVVYILALIHLWYE